MTTAHISTLPADQALEYARSGRILVAGAGVAGRGVLALALAVREKFNTAGGKAEGEVYAADDRPEALDGFAGAALVTRVGVDAARELIASSGTIDLVITSPGWRPDSLLLQEAIAAGIPTIGDIEFAWLLDQTGVAGEPRTWIAITGTNGKTTTTAMTAAMCRAAGFRAEAVGNIGQSPATAIANDLATGDYTQVLVAEVSSFQLHWSAQFTPDVGCVLNIAEDHLDWHGSLEGYAADKCRVMKATTPVIALDDALVRDLAMESNTVHESVWAFSVEENPAIPEGPERIGALVAVRDGRLALIDRDAQMIDLASADGISPPGPAGVADAAAAAAMSLAIGAKPPHIAAALEEFEVDAHRGQVVCRTDSTQWIDNSKATNPHAAAAALRGQTGVIWVAGGQLKGASVSELIAEVGEGFEAVIALGVDRKIILEDMDRQLPQVPTCEVEDTDPVAAMRRVVEYALEVIDRQPSHTHKVILAPAAASLDMYIGMSQRGDLFAQLARELTGQASETSGPQTAGK